MPLRLSNTLTGRTEEFRSIVPGQVSIYCCGVTVYDLCHLGHARSYIVWDVLRRYLIWQGYKVNFVQNFTDIDDKILMRAKEEGCSMHEVSERNIQAFHEDMDSLGILRPDSMPRATQSLDGIRSLISELEAKGAAYSVDGDVYFSVMKHAGYGKLSGRDLSEQQFNADGRVSDIEEGRKRHSFDFALWKSAKSGEPSFPSPWGAGRPGWHIECSAMVREELGNTIDIHLGGADLIFPHHENELAQSEAVNGKDLARFWLHNGMVNVGGYKMSKSLGNFTTIRSLLSSGISPMTLRLFILQAHYRKPLDFTNQALNAAKIGWKGLNRALCLGLDYASLLGWSDNKLSDQIDNNILHDLSNDKLKEFCRKFIISMDNDINSSGALAVIFEIARPLRTLANRLDRGDELVDIKSDPLPLLFSRWNLLVQVSGVLGLKAEQLQSLSSQHLEKIDELQIKAAISKRIQAKNARNFAKADLIRDELKASGIELIDKPGGNTEWIRINL